MRDISEWADLKYREGGQVTHVVAFGDTSSACAMEHARGTEWRGTGSIDEYERASALPVCPTCVARANLADYAATRSTAQTPPPGLRTRGVVE